MLLTDEKSIYLQISQMIEDNILKDVFPEGEKIPSTNELAKVYTINPATAAKGINLLVERGILFKKRGIGMFVSEGAKQQIISTRKDGFYEQFIVALVREAKNLQITKDELVQMIEKAQNNK